MLFCVQSAKDRQEGRATGLLVDFTAGLSSLILASVLQRCTGTARTRDFAGKDLLVSAQCAGPSISSTVQVSRNSPARLVHVLIGTPGLS